MSFVGKIFDIFGRGDKKFYARDFRNAYQIRPDINPPRQQFQGYVSFVLNRDLYEEFFKEQGQAFRLQIGSLVRKADLPSMEFKTDKKNQYNLKKIVNITTEFNPVSITVMDTVTNEWLTLFMKYYTYHYMNARNEGSGTRDVGRAPNYATATDFVNSRFGLGGNWDSNKAGFNPNITSYFFERIDYVLYHGNRAVQYSLLNPVLTSFKTTDIDYSSSELMNFDLTFEYENFTVYNELNFELSEFDVARFENASGFTGPAFTEGAKPPSITTNPIPLNILGDSVSARNRSIQPQPPAANTDQSDPADAGIQPIYGTIPIGGDISRAFEGSSFDNRLDRAVEQTSTFPSTYGNTATFSNGTGLKKSSFLEGLLGNVADAALSSAINGTNIRDAALSTVIGGVLDRIEPRLTQIGQAVVRPPKPTVEEPPTSAEPANVQPGDI